MKPKVSDNAKYTALLKRCKELGKPIYPKTHFTWVAAAVRGDAVMICCKRYKHSTFADLRDKCQDVFGGMVG